MADLSTPTHDGQSEQTAESLITQHIDIWTTAIERKSSAGRGTSNKFTLYGIKKLRELILELAVRGKLVPQDVNNEPASILLERIAAEKAQLVKDGKLKKQKPLPEISEDEKPFELPNRWEWSRLSQTGLGSTGKTPSTKQPIFFEGNIPFIGPGQITPAGIILKSDKFLSQSGLEHSSEAFPGDIFMVCIGGSIGKAAIVVERSGFNQQINCISPLQIESTYLYFALSTYSFYSSVLEKATGSATPIINRGKWEELLVPIAPLEEQHRIVAKVDELMSLCDALEAQTEASIGAHQTLVETLLNTLLLPNITQQKDSQSASPEPSFADSLEPALNESFVESWQRVAEHFDTLFTTEASIDTLKQTILQLAVMGKLVEQDPNDEPAAKLLERIAAEKAQLIKDCKIKKQKPLPAITDEEKPFELPQGWGLSRMGELALYQKGYAFKSKDYLNNGFMVTKIQNLTENNTQNTVYISPESALEFRQFLLVEDDIVMTTVGSWFSAPLSAVGRSFLINKVFDNSLLNQNAVRIRAFKELCSKYLYLCINSQIFKNYLVKEAQGTANQASITQTSIKQFLIGIPPLEEQHRIVAKVDELMALCDQLKVRLRDAQTTQLQLTDAIVEQAV